DGGRRPTRHGRGPRDDRSRPRRDRRPRAAPREVLALSAPGARPGLGRAHGRPAWIRAAGRTVPARAPAVPRRGGGPAAHAGDPTHAPAPERPRSEALPLVERRPPDAGPRRSPHGEHLRAARRAG